MFSLYIVQKCDVSHIYNRKRKIFLQNEKTNLMEYPIFNEMFITSGSITKNSFHFFRSIWPPIKPNALFSNLDSGFSSYYFIFFLYFCSVWVLFLFSFLLFLFCWVKNYINSRKRNKKKCKTENGKTWAKKMSTEKQRKRAFIILSHSSSCPFFRK